MSKPGKVLEVFDANGWAVGKIVSTGDDLEDFKLAHKIFEDGGLSSTDLTEAQSIFDHSISFKKTAHFLFEMIARLGPRSKYFVAPLAVNSVFAIELQLKAIGKQHGLSLRGHKLLGLFQALPVDVVQRIRSLGEVVVVSHDISVLDMEKFLSNLNEVFVRWRYPHEFEENQFQLKQAMFLLDLFDRFAKSEIPKISRKPT